MSNETKTFDKIIVVYRFKDDPKDMQRKYISTPTVDGGKICIVPENAFDGKPWVFIRFESYWPTIEEIMANASA